MWSISTHGWRGWLLRVQPGWLMENTEEWNCTFECCRLKDWAWSELSLSARIWKRLINCSCHHRKEIPPKEDQWEKAAHKGVHRQAAAVGHLEDGERVLRVCAGAVPVRPGARRQRKGRGALSAGSKLLLRENLPQELTWWGGKSGTNGDGLTGGRSGERSASDWAIRLRYKHICACWLDRKFTSVGKIVPSRQPPLPHLSQQPVHPRPRGIGLSRIQRTIFIGSVLFGCVRLYFTFLVLLSFVSNGGFHGDTRSCLTTATNLNRF